MIKSGNLRVKFGFKTIKNSRRHVFFCKLLLSFDNILGPFNKKITVYKKNTLLKYYIYHLKNQIRPIYINK